MEAFQIGKDSGEYTRAVTGSIIGIIETEIKNGRNLIRL